MAMPTDKYEHIKMSVYKVPKLKREPRFDRKELLSIYVATHDIIERADLEKMSYNHIEHTLDNYTKRTGTKFEQINYYTWRKVKTTR